MIKSYRVQVLSTQLTEYKIICHKKCTAEQSVTLTLKDPIISESCIETKIELNLKALKAFIEPFEAPQRSAKIKI